ncbi:transposase [Akkermansiaceae bacterium]|nr:transposase [Akkermansiaceae bacterium]
MFGTLFSLSFSDLDSIARKSGLIRRRSRKLSASGFLLALLRSVTKGDASLSHLAMQLGTLQSSAMSRQSMHKHFSPASTSFLLTDLPSGDVLSSALHNARDSDQALGREILDHCRQADLIVRDMGFFNLESLHVIEAREAFWISRFSEAPQRQLRPALGHRDPVPLPQAILPDQSGAHTQKRLLPS